MLIAYCLAQSYRRGYMGSERRFSGAEKWRAVVDARWALLIPFIILGGIYSGLFTPTESAAIAVIYSLVFGVFVYREITLRGLFDIILESALLVGTVLVIVGTSVAFGRILSIERIPAEIAGFILSLTDNALLILLAINLLLLIVGTFMETPGGDCNPDADSAAGGDGDGHPPGAFSALSWWSTWRSVL